MLSGHILDRAWLGSGARPSAAVVRRTIEGAVEMFLRGYGVEGAGVEAGDVARRSGWLRVAAEN
jgi:hypothetical protein